MSKPPPRAGGDGTRAREARAALEAALDRLARGERAALGDIYATTNRKLFGIVLRILGDARDAEDTLHDVYAALDRKAAGFDPRRASPISWLAVMARNRAIDALRRRRSGDAPVEAGLDIPDPQPLADEDMIDAERSARIHGCLAGLDPAQGAVIRRAFMDGHSYARLAADDGVPLGTMKSRIRRGLARLKRCLEGGE